MSKLTKTQINQKMLDDISKSKKEIELDSKDEIKKFRESKKKYRKISRIILMNGKKRNQIIECDFDIDLSAV